MQRLWYRIWFSFRIFIFGWKLILGNWPTQWLDGTTLTAETLYTITFTDSNRRTVVSLHYNGDESFLFVGATKIYQFKAKDVEIKNYPLCLGNVSKDFTVENIKKRIQRNCKIFFWL